MGRKQVDRPILVGLGGLGGMGEGGGGLVSLGVGAY